MINMLNFYAKLGKTRPWSIEINRPRDYNGIGEVMMITIADIAKATGLSTASVSNALSGKGRVSAARRQQVLDTARAMGYDFQRIRAAEPRRVIAVVVEGLSVRFCVEIAEGLWRAACDNGYQVKLYNLDLLREVPDYNPPRSRLETGLRAIAPQLDDGTMGLVYISQYPRDLTGVMPPLPFPVVYAYCYTNDNAPSVNTDDQQGAYIAVRHLLDLGKRRIAMVSGPINSLPMTKRFSGYQRALIDAGMAVDLNLVKLGQWDVRYSCDSMRALLALNPPPDGVFCQSDHIAVGVCQAIREAGLRIPRDIAVVGFDNYDFAGLVSPTLTTVAQPLHEIGRTAFDQLQRILERRGVESTSILLPATLVRREST